jgi:hypothetical protein
MPENKRSPDRCSRSRLSDAQSSDRDGEPAGTSDQSPERRPSEGLPHAAHSAHLEALESLTRLGPEYAQLGQQGRDRQHGIRPPGGLWRSLMTVARAEPGGNHPTTP